MVKKPLAIPAKGAAEYRQGLEKATPEVRADACRAMLDAGFESLTRTVQATRWRAKNDPSLQELHTIIALMHVSWDEVKQQWPAASLNDTGD